MKLYYSLTDDALISAPGVRQKLGILEGLKRGSQTLLEVQFLEGENAETPTTLAASSLLHFGLKLPGKYEGDWLAFVDDDQWTQPAGGGASPWYRAVLNLNTTELNTAFSTPNANAADDVATVTTMTVFSVREPANDNPRFADEMVCTVANSGDIGTEAIPALDLPGLTSRLSTAETNITNLRTDVDELLTNLPAIFLPTVNAYTGGSGALDGVVTTGGVVQANTYAIFTGPTGAMEFYLLLAGTNAESSPDVILPDDYDAGLNAKYWQRQVPAQTQTLSGTGALGAVSLSIYPTIIRTIGGAATSTLAAGTEGLEKRLYMATDGGDMVVTVTNLNGGTTITFNDVDDFVDLHYLFAKWRVIKNTGCTIA